MAARKKRTSTTSRAKKTTAVKVGGRFAPAKKAPERAYKAEGGRVVREAAARPPRAAKASPGGVSAVALEPPPAPPPPKAPADLIKWVDYFLANDGSAQGERRLADVQSKGKWTADRADPGTMRLLPPLRTRTKTLTDFIDFAGFGHLGTVKTGPRSSRACVLVDG